MRSRTAALSIFALIALSCLFPLRLHSSAAADEVSFTNDIYPILTDRCLGCHQPTTKSGGLVMTSYADFKQGGKHGTSFVPGRADASVVMKFISGELEPRMPKNMAPLSDLEVELIRKWIQQGAVDDTASASSADLSSLPPPVYKAPPVITALAYSPDGKILAVSGNHEILLHASDGPGTVARLVGRAERIHSIVFSADGRTLAAVGGSPARMGEVQIWDVEKRKLTRHIRVAVDMLYGAAFSPDGKFLSYGCADKTIRILSVDTGEEIKKMEHHADGVFATTFSLDGKRLVSVSRDHFVKLTEVSSGTFIENLNLLTKATFGGQGELFCLARHPRSDIVVTGGEDRVPRLYTMNRPRAIKIDDDSCLLREFEPQSGPVLAVAFSPNGSKVAVAGMSEQINLYDAKDGEKRGTFSGHQGGIYAIAFHPNGNELAAAGFDGSVRIYDLTGQKTTRVFVPVPVEKKMAEAGSGR
ncbi:MAG TPA: c-type cytochrome domain-containing protein [Acidobacteriota bacterium]